MDASGTPPSPCECPTATRRRDGRRALGMLGEDLAAAHLERLGFVVLARNVRTRHGEIDLIAFHRRTLVFVEVKTRRAARHATAGGSELYPLAALGHRQRARLRRLAAAWLSEKRATRPRAGSIRFDAIGVVVDARGCLVCLEHLEAAW